MNEELESKMNKIGPDQLDLVSGGAGSDYKLESGELDIQERMKAMQEDSSFDCPHSKKVKGRLIR